MKKPIRAIFIFTTLVLTGCVSAPSDLHLSESHPANPAAAQAAHTSAAPFLMAETNLVIMKPVPTHAPEHEHDHDANPETGTPPEHDHH
jgi:hypothetical protein